MFGFLGRLFGTEKALEGVVSGVTKGLDALVYTDQEKAEDYARARTEARQMVVQWLAATQGQNLARRLIALSITGVWLMMYLFSVLTSMLAVVWADRFEALDQLSQIARESASDMTTPVMLILSFYFAAPHMGSIATAAVGRFTGQVKAPDRTG